MLVLSRTLFGAELPLRDFPVLKSVRGLGIADSDVYAERLARLFSYTNMHYHREPRFDLLRPEPGEFGKYDFVICSDVLEHVEAPVAIAFDTLAQLLKPTGFLVLTAPYALDPVSLEHFPVLNEFGLAEVGGKTVLVNRSPNGQYEVYDGLRFHGGSGATLEMRVFSETAIREHLRAAGLHRIRIHASGSDRHGILSGECSVPIVASREPFVLTSSAITELTGQFTFNTRVLRMVRQSRWVRIGRFFGLGPKIENTGLSI